MRALGESKLRCLLLPLVAAAFFACGDDDDDVEADADVNPDAAGGCTSLLTVNETFGLPQEVGDRSFQTHAYFDGDGVWIAHAIAPVGGDSIQIQCLRVRCDGSVASAPVVISPDNGFTHTEPRITGFGDKVMVAWQTDNSGNPNLSTHFRIFDRLAGPGDEATVHLDTQYMGDSAGNTWMPSLAASSSGFAVAGLRGVSDYSSFQSFVQRVDFEGEMVGAAVNGKLQDDLSQGDAALSIDDAGDIILAWDREESGAGKHVVHARIAAGQDTPESEPIRVSPNLGSQAALDGPYLASGLDAGGLMLKQATTFDPDSASLALGTSGTVALYPQPAASEGGGAVAWLEGTTGFNAEIHMQAFLEGGASITASGDEITIPTDNPSVAPYRLSLVHVADSVYLLTWTEGPTSDLQVKWRFVDMNP
jgi:hypothetical protein